MSNGNQEKLHASVTVGIDLDEAIADAQGQIREIDSRRKELMGVIRSFTQLKERQMPSEIFSVPVVRLDANR
jgi:hypothetical protein